MNEKLVPEIHAAGADEKLTETTAVAGEAPMSEEEFALFGGGEIAYIRAVPASELASDMPEIAALPPGSKVYVVHAADGAPIVLAANRETAVFDAQQRGLVAQTVH